jgi:hypothetical protein
MIGTESVLVISVIDSHFDGDGCVDEADDSGRNSDEVRVSSIGRTREPGIEELAGGHQRKHRQADIWARVP